MATKKILTDLELDGSITSSTFNIGSTASYIRNNAGDTELFADSSLSIESGDGMLIEISDVIEISGGGEITSDGSIEAASFIKTGGTSSQFLKADGSVDSSTYLTSGDVDLSGYLPLSGGTLTGDLAIPNTLSHAGDSNTSLQFAADQLVLKAGGRTIIKMDEGSDPDKIQLGDSTTITYTEGSLGVGTDSPNYKLHVLDNSVTSGTGTALELQSEVITNGGSLNLDFRVSSSNTANRYVARISGVREGDAALSQLQFWTESSGLKQRMTILSGGNVGIGTNDPQAKLDVDGGIRMANDTTTASADNEGTMRYYTDVDGSYVDMCMQYQNSGTPANDYEWVNIVRNIFPS